MLQMWPVGDSKAVPDMNASIDVPSLQAVILLDIISSTVWYMRKGPKGQYLKCQWVSRTHCIFTVIARVTRGSAEQELFAKIIEPRLETFVICFAPLSVCKVFTMYRMNSLLSRGACLKFCKLEKTE